MIKITVNYGNVDIQLYNYNEYTITCNDKQDTHNAIPTPINEQIEKEYQQDLEHGLDKEQIEIELPAGEYVFNISDYKNLDIELDFYLSLKEGRKFRSSIDLFDKDGNPHTFLFIRELIEISKSSVYELYVTRYIQYGHFASPWEKELCLMTISKIPTV